MTGGVDWKPWAAIGAVLLVMAGIGVLLAESVKQAESMVELLQSQKQNVLIQKFVAESKGRDIRAFVVGDRVVAAMRRVAQGDEFRSNVHRGGSAEPVDITPAYERAAVRAALLEWGRLQWPAAAPRSIGELDARVDAPLSDELCGLSAVSYGKDAAEWDGTALASALGSVTILAEDSVPGARETLPPLMPPAA